MKTIVFILLILFQYPLVAQQITQVQLRDLEHGLNERIINKIARDTFGFFYLFSNNSIQRYDGTDFENVDLPIGAEKLLKDIKEVRPDNKGGLLIHAKGNEYPLQIAPAGLTSNYNKIHDGSISEDDQIKIDDTLAKYIIRGNDTIVASRGSFWKYVDGDLSQLGYNDLVGFNCNVLTQDKYGNIIAAFGYIPNECDSVFVLRTNGEISNYSGVLNYNDKLKDIYTDDINHRWMMATFNGLYVVTFKRLGIEVFHMAENISSSGFGYIVMTVSADGPDVLYADENYGLRRIDESGKVELLFPDETVHFFSNDKIKYDHQKDQYLITANYTDEESILYITDTTYTKLEKQIIPFKVRDFHIIGEDELLLVGENRAIVDKDISGRSMIWNRTSSTGRMILNSIPNVRSVELINDKYWMATSNGLFLFDTLFTNQQKIDNGIGDTYILCLKEISGKVYVGSNGGGLYILDKEKKDVIAHYNKNNFLSDNIVASIEEDNVGNIWIGTFNGINVLNKSGHIISKLMGYDGISHREMNTNAISKDDQGSLYFGTLNGLTKVNPADVLDWSFSYGLHVSNATAYYKKNGKVIDIYESPIPIELGFDSLMISLYFPDYIMNKFDTPLNYLKVNIDNERVLSHDYKKLLIKSSDIESNSTLKLSSENNSFADTLIFSPTLNYTPALITFLVLLCLVGLVLATFYRQRITAVVTEQNKKIELNKRIAELELSALQSQMNPHFIFNALGAIQYFIQTQNTDEADDFLADFALLMRKILESSKSKYFTLKEEKEILDLYINLEQLRFKELFIFNWHIDDSIDMEMIIPPMILQPFIENAINHGLFTLKDKIGKLDIYVDQISDSIVQFEIEDNGIGRKKSALLRNKKHKPRGLQIVNERISTLNSLGDIEIEVKTDDLFENEEPSGTMVTINIKYNNLEREVL